MKFKIVTGKFLVQADDAEELVEDLSNWFYSNEIDMEWHDIHISGTMDPGTFANYGTEEKQNTHG